MIRKLLIVVAIFHIAICNIQAQECSPFQNNVKTPWFDPKSPIKYSASAGMCYHYDGFTFGLHYKNVAFQTVLMRPARYRTMRMAEEAYLVAGYDKRLGIGGGLRVNDDRVSPVGYVSGRQKLFGSFYGNVAYYQTVGMSHLVVGLKIVL